MICRVKQLLDAGAHVNTANQYGYTDLMNATLKGHSEVVEILRAAGASDNPGGGAAAAPDLGEMLRRSAEDGNCTEIQRLVINKGADVNATNIYGRTPLMHAAMNGRDIAVKELLTCNANVRKIRAFFIITRTCLPF